jgi:hypothetical protein
LKSSKIVQKEFKCGCCDRGLWGLKSMKSMNSMKTMVEINMIFISSLRSILEKQWENNG